MQTNRKTCFYAILCMFLILRVKSCIKYDLLLFNGFTEKFLWFNFRDFFLEKSAMLSSIYRRHKKPAMLSSIYRRHKKPAKS